MARPNYTKMPVITSFHSYIIIGDAAARELDITDRDTIDLIDSNGTWYITKGDANAYVVKHSNKGSRTLITQNRTIAACLYQDAERPKVYRLGGKTSLDSRECWKLNFSHFKHRKTHARQQEQPI